MSGDSKEPGCSGGRQSLGGEIILEKGYNPPPVANVKKPRPTPPPPPKKQEK